MAPIAQLAEQRPLKPKVVGSSPTGGTKTITNCFTLKRLYAKIKKDIE